MAFPTGIKDVDLKILMDLDDKSLFKTCTVDRYTKRICNDEHFWRNRLYSRFGKKAIDIKPIDRTWKNHYLQIVIDLDRFVKIPINFLDIIAWDKEGIEKSFFFDFENPKVVPLNEAPEWVMNNFWFLDLGEMSLNIFWLLNSEDGYKPNIRHFKPYELLQIQWKNSFNRFIKGFHKITHGMYKDLYIPKYIEREEIISFFEVPLL